MSGQGLRATGRPRSSPGGVRLVDASAGVVLASLIAALAPFAFSPMVDGVVAVAAGVAVGVVCVLSVRFGAVTVAVALLLVLTTLTYVVLKSNHDRSHVTQLLPWTAVAVASVAALATIVRSRHGWQRSPARRLLGIWALPLLLFGVVDGLALLACRLPPG